MDAEQLNFFDILDNTRKHRLHPALEQWQDEYDEIMQKNVKAVSLCRTWKNAEKNKAGVYTTNSRFFPVGEHNKEFMELHLALDFPHVYGELNIATGAPFYYGICCPVTESSRIRFEVTDDAEFVKMFLKHSVFNIIEAEGNLSIQQKERMSGMIDKLVLKAITDIEETNE